MELVEKVHAVKLLLGSLHDPYPTPQGALRPDSGPSPSRYIPCETCRSTGRVRARGGFLVCLVCGGDGERRRERGDAPWDAYMRLPIEEAAEIPREPEPARLPPPEGSGYAWERAQAAQERHGSYRELRRQLDWLRQAQPRRHQLVMVVLVERQERELSPRAELDLELGVVALALRMRRPRVPRWVLGERPAQPAQTVPALAARGMTAGQIARVLGTSKTAVKRQLRRLRQRETRRQFAINSASSG